MSGPAIAKSILDWFSSGEPWKSPELKWVKVIRSTSQKDITLGGIFDDGFNWDEFDEPMTFVVRETDFCVVADYGDGPHGYFVSTDEYQAESVAQAMRENRLQDVVTFS